MPKVENDENIAVVKIEDHAEVVSIGDDGAEVGLEEGANILFLYRSRSAEGKIGKCTEVGFEVF